MRRSGTYGFPLPIQGPKTVNMINEDMLKKIKTKEGIYFSTDESKVEKPMDIDAIDHGVEALNDFNPAVIPPHRLHL